MPSFPNIVSFENSKDSNTIRLILSGGFYRAFNHSAWLFSILIQKYSVVRKYVKPLQQYIYYIGFPQSSIEKIVGQRELRKSDFGVDIILNDSEIPSNNDGYDLWILEQSVTHASAANFHSLPLTRQEAQNEIVNRLMSFPMEQKTMVECVVFLSELRRLLEETK